MSSSEKPPQPMPAYVQAGDIEMADWGRKFRDSFSSREMAFFLFDEPDYDAQQRAIRGMLALRKKADERFAAELKDIENFIKTAKGDASDRAIDEWVDHLHNGVFEDAAHSMAAVGMLAPFMESLFEQAFYGVRELFGREGRQLTGQRACMLADKQWNCHYKNDGHKDLVKGIFQLANATGLERHLPTDLKMTLEALYIYRNRNFHLGLEWPMEDRKKFAANIISKGWPTGWFDKSQTGGDPWIFYMSDKFISHCLDTVELVLEGLGAFYREASG